MSQTFIIVCTHRHNIKAHPPSFTPLPNSYSVENDIDQVQTFYGLGSITHHIILWAHWNNMLLAFTTYAQLDVGEKKWEYDRVRNDQVLIRCFHQEMEVCWKWRLKGLHDKTDVPVSLCRQLCSPPPAHLLSCIKFISLLPQASRCLATLLPRSIILCCEWQRCGKVTFGCLVNGGRESISFGRFRMTRGRRSAVLPVCISIILFCRRPLRFSVLAVAQLRLEDAVWCGDAASELFFSFGVDALVKGFALIYWWSITFWQDNLTLRMGDAS